MNIDICIQFSQAPLPASLPDHNQFIITTWRKESSTPWPSYAVYTRWENEIIQIPKKIYQPAHQYEQIH